MENDLKEEVLKYETDPDEHGEEWGLYCFAYAMNQVFDREEIEDMTDLELENLERLAGEIYNEIREKEYFDEWGKW